jgi:hypothetical protein
VEEYRLRVFEHMVLARIFGPRRDEVTEGWRKLHKQEHHNLYSSPSNVKEDELGRAWSTNKGEKECLWEIQHGVVSTALIWFRFEASRGLL